MGGAAPHRLIQERPVGQLLRRGDSDNRLVVVGIAHRHTNGGKIRACADARGDRIEPR